MPASNQARIAMIHLAIAPFSHYQCDTREIVRESASYTIETLKSLRQDYPHDSLTFTMGIDAFNDLDQWDDFEYFLDYAHLLIFPRPGYELKINSSVQKLVNQAETKQINQLHQKKHGFIYFSSEPNHAVSSTEIRALLKNKHLGSSRLANYLPEDVLAYIQKSHIFNL